MRAAIPPLSLHLSGVHKTTLPLTEYKDDKLMPLTVKNGLDASSVLILWRFYSPVRKFLEKKMRAATSAK
jgi:hypothetical protein